MAKNNPAQLDAILSEFVMNTMNGIIVFDGSDRIMFCNNVAARMYGAECSSDLYDKTFSQIVSNCHKNKIGLIIDTDDLDAWLAYANNKRRSQSFRRFEVDTVDGSWFLISEQVVADDCIVMIATDITDKKNAEDRLTEMSKELFFLATTDALTNTFNRRHFIDQALIEQQRCQREHLGYSLLMLDLDYFKRINDNHGHGCGDAVLTTVAETIKLELRTYDLLGRIGGEEFAVLLTNTTQTSALSAAQRIRAAIENLQIESRAKIIQVTTSIGLAFDKNADKDIEEMFLIADKLLYQAKENGRNQVAAEN